MNGPRGTLNGVKVTGRARVVCGALAAAGVAVVTAVASDPSVTKGVDRLYAPSGAVLDYAVTVTNLADPAVDVGLFTDDFPAQLAGCTWTCSATGGGWCELAGGGGDIGQLLSVPVGATVTIGASCTFAPSPGQECAANVAAFLTMDPDTTTRGFATTCQEGVTVFFDGFESGDPGMWSMHTDK